MTEPYKVDYDKVIYCPICNATDGSQNCLEFHHAFIFHGIYHTEGQVGIWACDESWKCPKCRNVQMFGFPITKAQYDATFEAWNGHHEWAPISKEAIAKRLSDLGYLDVTKEGPVTPPLEAHAPGVVDVSKWEPGTPEPDKGLPHEPARELKLNKEGKLECEDCP